MIRRAETAARVPAVFGNSSQFRSTDRRIGEIRSSLSVAGTIFTWMVTFSCQVCFPRGGIAEYHKGASDEPNRRSRQVEGGVSSQLTMMMTVGPRPSWFWNLDVNK